MHEGDLAGLDFDHAYPAGRRPVLDCPGRLVHARDMRLHLSLGQESLRIGRDRQESIRIGLSGRADCKGDISGRLELRRDHQLYAGLSDPQSRDWALQFVLIDCRDDLELIGSERDVERLTMEQWNADRKRALAS